MGVVLEARDRRSGETVALKMMLTPGGAEEVTRFEREARILAGLKHPHIVGVRDIGTHQGRPWFAMEFIAGRPLHRRGDPPIEIEAARRHFLELAEALMACKSSGIVHRDLKPENVVINTDDGRTVLVDFGLVRRDDSSSRAGQSVRLTGTGTLLGTPWTMAPEQLDPAELGPASFDSDVWGFGATMYLALTGHPPFPGDTPIAIYRALSSAPPPDVRERRPDCPDWLAELIIDCLTFDRDDRPEIETIHEGFLQESFAAESRPAKRGPTARRLALAVGAALLLIISLVVGASLLRPPTAVERIAAAPPARRFQQLLLELPGLDGPQLESAKRELPVDKANALTELETLLSALPTLDLPARSRLTDLAEARLEVAPLPAFSPLLELPTLLALPNEPLQAAQAADRVALERPEQALEALAAFSAEPALTGRRLLAASRAGTVPGSLTAIEQLWSKSPIRHPEKLRALRAAAALIERARPRKLGDRELSDVALRWLERSKELVRRFPEQPGPRLCAATIEIRLGRYGAATERLERLERTAKVSPKLSPEPLRLARVQARALRAQDRGEDAIATLQPLARGPRDLVFLGLLRAELGLDPDPEAALTELPRDDLPGALAAVLAARSRHLERGGEPEPVRTLTPVVRSKLIDFVITRSRNSLEVHMLPRRAAHLAELLAYLPETLAERTALLVNVDMFSYRYERGLARLKRLETSGPKPEAAHTMRWQRRFLRAARLELEHPELTLTEALTKDPPETVDACYAAALALTLSDRPREADVVLKRSLDRGDSPAIARLWTAKAHTAREADYLRSEPAGFTIRLTVAAADRALGALLRDYPAGPRSRYIRFVQAIRADDFEAAARRALAAIQAGTPEAAELAQQSLRYAGDAGASPSAHGEPDFQRFLKERRQDLALKTLHDDYRHAKKIAPRSAPGALELLRRYDAVQTLPTTPLMLRAEIAMSLGYVSAAIKDRRVLLERLLHLEIDPLQRLSMLLAFCRSDSKLTGARAVLRRRKLEHLIDWTRFHFPDPQALRRSGRLEAANARLLLLLAANLIRIESQRKNGEGVLELLETFPFNSRNTISARLIALEGLGRWEAVRKLTEAKLKASSKVVDVLVGRVLSAHHFDETDVLDRSRESFRGEPQRRMQSACYREVVHQGRLSSREFRVYDALWPEDPILRGLKAFARWRQSGDPAPELAAIEPDQSSSPILQGLAAHHAGASGDPERAKALFAAVTGRTERDELTVLVRLDALASTGDLTAIEQLREALAPESSLLGDCALVRVCLRLNQRPRSPNLQRELTRQCIKLVTDAEATAALAGCRLLIGHLPTALVASRRLVDLNPGVAAWLALHARVLIAAERVKLGDPEQARACLENALKLDPRHPDAGAWRARLKALEQSTGGPR